MTKSTLLRWLDDVTNKLREMRIVLERLPDAEERLDERATNHKSQERATNQLCSVRFVNKEKLRPIVDSAFAAMGVRGEPIGAEKVQAMVAACGVRPEDNLLSRGIIDMREE